MDKVSGGSIFFYFFYLRTFSNVLFYFFLCSNAFLDLSEPKWRRNGQGKRGGVFFFIFFYIGTPSWTFPSRNGVEMDKVSGGRGGVFFFIFFYLRTFSNVLLFFF